VTPALSDAGPQFASTYSAICKKINVGLAPNCANCEKAFSDSTTGTVLGIRFDSLRQTWTISPEKRDRILKDIANALRGDPITLEDMQRLLGKLNDFMQMAPFLKGFRLPLNSFLARLLKNPDKPRRLTVHATRDLRVWAAAVASTVTPMPIPHRPLSPSLSTLHFISDAAGARYVSVHNRRLPSDTPGNKGAASIGILDSGHIWFCSKVTWPEHLLLHARDENDRAYGCKSTTLEVIGLILPIITIPHILRGREVCLHVDNIAVVYGWENRGAKRDHSASIFLRALHILSAFLGCIVHVRHIPRMSTPDARLADRLSRRQTTTPLDSNRISSALKPTLPRSLTRWLQQPKADWNLPMDLLRDVQETLHRHSTL